MNKKSLQSIPNTFLSPSFDDIYDITLNLAENILKSDIKIDLMIGISRGGLFPTRLLSDILGVNQIEIIHAQSYQTFQKIQKIKIKPISIEIKNKNILLVDDVSDTGETLHNVKKYLEKLGASNVLIAVLYEKTWNKIELPFPCKKTSAWIIFPWERMESLEKLIKTDPNLHKKRLFPEKIFINLLNIIKEKNSKLD